MFSDIYQWLIHISEYNNIYLQVISSHNFHFYLSLYLIHVGQFLSHAIYYIILVLIIVFMIVIL